MLCPVGQVGGGVVVPPFPTRQGSQRSRLSSELSQETPVLVLSLRVTSPPGNCRSSPACLISAHTWKEDARLLAGLLAALVLAAGAGTFFVPFLTAGWVPVMLGPLAEESACLSLQPNRTYYLMDPSGNAHKWCRKIQEVWRHRYQSHPDAAVQ